MSLLPYLFGYEEIPVSRLLEPYFKPEMGDILALDPLHTHNRHQYLRPWRQMQASLRDIGSSIKADKDKFQVNLDVQHFGPEEINVKVVDGHIVVEGKHEEKKDEHGYISRQFVRRYALPENCNIEAVSSKLSSDGVLTVVAPKKDVHLPGERSIPITHTGPVRKEVSQQNEIKEEEKKK